MAKNTEKEILAEEEKNVASEKKNDKKNNKVKPKLTKSEIRRLLKDAEVDIIANDNAQLIYHCGRTKEELYLSGFGDAETVSMGLLQSMKSSSRSFFTKHWIIIEDVYVPNCDEDITVEDVYTFLGLGSIYESIKDVDCSYFENILNNDSFEDFERRIGKMDKKLLTQLINRAVDLYRGKKFSDSFKIDLMEKKIDKIDLFRDSI